jgi:hypothetical protein
MVQGQRNKDGNSQGLEPLQIGLQQGFTAGRRLQFSVV